LLLSLLVLMQAPLQQVPVGQGPPVLPQAHCPFTQLSAIVTLQVTHKLPVDPQALVLVPAWQFPWASQQPVMQLHTQFPF
jgi:hypothetical protein